MAFENMDDIEPTVEEAGPPPEESNNRPFFIVAGILGAIMVLSLLCVAAYALFLYPANQRASATQAAKAIAQSTEMAISIQMTKDAQSWTATPTPVRATNTAVPFTPTNTPVLAQVFSTNTPAPDPRTATVAALLTQAAGAAQATPTRTPTALPQGGFADEVGVPGMLALSVVLVAVIFLARRLRTAVS